MTTFSETIERRADRLRVVGFGPTPDMSWALLKRTREVARQICMRIQGIQSSVHPPPICKYVP